MSISALTCAGTVTLNGNVTLGNASADDITFTGSLASTIPIKTTNTYNIGSSTLGLAGVYLGANSQTVRIVGSASMSATYTLTLPVATGSANTVMYTSGSGVLAFGSLTNAMVDASAAIAGTKIDPTFGSQNVFTTGKIGIGDGGSLTPEAAIHIEENATDADTSLLIRNRVAGASSSNYLLWLDYSADADLDGARFITFHDSDGQIGSVTGDGAATAYNTSSDARLKENVAPITNAIERAKQLKPSTYNWKKNGRPGEGFIAQELIHVVPLAVSGTPDAELPMGVDYSKVVPLLSAALLELIARVEKLEAAS